MLVPDYKTLGHRFKKRRLLSNIRAWIFSSRLKGRDRKIHPNTCVILRLDHIGDYLLFRNFLPVFRNSAKFEGYHLTLCGNIVFKELAEYLDSDVVDDFIWIDIPKFKKHKDYFKKMCSHLYERGFAVALHPTYSRDIYADIVTLATAAEQRIGVDGDLSNQDKDQRYITDLFYSKLIPVHGATKFEFDRNREITRAITNEYINREKPNIVLKGREILLKNYAVFIPGTSSELKLWTKFDQIADYLNKKHNLIVVFIGKGKMDRQLIEKIIRQSGVDFINLCDRTSLVDVAGIISGARIVVGNDSGIMHMSAMLKKPTVALTSGTHAFRFNCYPKEFGLNVHFVLPPELEAIKGTETFKRYSAQYDSGYSVHSVSVERVKKAIEDALSNES